MQYLLTGGSLFYGAIHGRAAQLQQAEMASAALPKSSDSGLISEKLMLKIQEKGIPVDVDNFFGKLADLERDIDMGLGVNKRSLYALLAQANRIIQQADYLEKAEKNAESKESLGEVAVGGRGLLFIMNDLHQVSSISASEYNQEKHGPALTVGELIEHRKFNPTQAFDTDITRVVNDNIGMSKIQEYIQKIVNTVGSAETSSEAYSDLTRYIGGEAAKKPTGRELEALQQLYVLASKEGMSDAIFKMKQSDKSGNLEAGLRYIQSVLPRDIKYLLLGRNVAAGNSFESSGNYINSLIVNALTSSNDTKSSRGIDYDASINKAAGTLAGNKDLVRNLTPLEQLVQGSLGKRDYLIISSSNPELSMTLHGNGIGSLASINGKIVDKMPLEQALGTGLAAVVDELHISAGGLKIDPALLETILYNGGDVINVWAPMDANGDVDLEQLALLLAIQEICDNNPSLRPEDKNQLLEQYGLSGSYDDKGVYHGDPRTMGQFLVMTGLTSDEVIDDDNTFADKLSKDKKDAAMKLIDRIYGQLNKGLKGDAKYEFQKGWFNWSTDLYRVPIFMKLGKTAQIDVGTFSGKGPMVTTPTYQEQLAYDLIQNSQPTRQLGLTSTSALYGE